MKQKCFGILLALFVCVSVPATAQLFKPFTSFRVIKTERFDIIFPEESESSARLLASYADCVYDQVSSLLNIEYPGRIPVTFAPHTDLYNAYYQFFPGSHIVLFDTPMNLETMNDADSLKDTFLHELTHAVSLNTRSRFYRGLHRIFGNWASPALINAPLFMVEGVTVSFESLDGFGRANDPLTKQVVRQAIHEDKFPTPFQTSGVYDIPGQSGIYYEYGGLFSAWLQQTYGMEKYADLWQAMDRSLPFSFFVYRSDYYRIFKNVYGVDFMDEWNVFRVSLALDDIEENPGEIFPKKYRFFTEKRNTISALTAVGSAVYVLDGTEKKIRVYDTRNGQERAFNTDFPLSYDLDVSADGSTLLVSGYHITGERYSAVVTEHRTDSGKKTGRTIREFFRARYFRNGVIGLRPELHNICIVYEDFNGNSEILFRGNEELLFSGPQAVDDERIVFVASRKGVRELLLYNYVSGELFRIENSEGDNEYWRYMRGLGVSDGKIFFSHNANDRMYKLASIDLETMRAVFSERDFSGGVFYPVSAGGDVYYRGDFLSGDGVLRFPETASSISGTQTGIMLVRADNEHYGMAARANTEIKTQDWNILIKPPYSRESKHYFGIRYMNPFKFWLPMPLIRVTGSGLENFFNNFSLDGGGLMSVITEPTDRNFITFTAFADIPYRMAQANILWRSTVPGFPLTTQFSDMVIANPYGNPYRDTRAGLSGVFEWYPGRWYHGFSMSGTYVRIANNDGGEGAYTWGETESAFFLSAGFTLSDHHRRQNELFGTGLYLNVRGLSVVGNFDYRFEWTFRASLETRFPFRFTLYSAYDVKKMNLHGVSRVYGQPSFAQAASTEYSHPDGLDLTWVAGGEASVGLFSLEIQRNLSHFYFNRFFSTLSLKNAIYDSKDHPDAQGIAINDMRLAQSLLLRLNLLFSLIPIKHVPFFVEPYIWGSWNFSNTITGKGLPWNYGIGFNIYY